MSIQDPIANLFSSINNAQARSKEIVKVPSSTKKLALLSMLKQEGYIHSFTSSEGSKPEIEIKLKYFEGAPVPMMAGAPGSMAFTYTSPPMHSAQA